MNYISTIIKYPPKVPFKYKKGLTRSQQAVECNRRKRAKWAADGLCMQCGGERPCNHSKKRKVVK